MRQWTATHLAKLARKASRAVGKNGTDLPGQIARRVDQNILRKLSEQVDDIVFISGTNGKTTTSNLIGHTLKANQMILFITMKVPIWQQVLHLPSLCKQQSKLKSLLLK